ncbi:MAG: lycopene beta-cyclase CrtY [Sphingomicrobium sp.]
MPIDRPDLIILGGGLAGGLAALALRQARPALAVTIVEPGLAIGGHHLWSYFGSDVESGDRQLVDPLAAHRWPGYRVRFPGRERQLAEPYYTIESEALDTAVRASGAAIVQASAVHAAPTEVHLDNGKSLSAPAVLDTRGIAAAPVGLRCGWQKFVGQLLDVPTGHGLAEPLVMDAAVDQADGYRFVYCLPFSPTQVFVEDTYYSDSPGLDPTELAGRIAAYAAGHGWTVASISRTERGVLPVVTGGRFDAFWPATDTVARGGVRAGLFHPLTSYSLPDAVRFASWLAAHAPLDSRLGGATRNYAEAHWRRGNFDRLLARLLMEAADPPQRFRVLERFYRLPAPLIARFYAGRSTLFDRARILVGRPPVSLARAIRAVGGTR